MYSFQAIIRRNVSNVTHQFEKLGYRLVKAGNIPGFYTDLDTGKPGPKIAILGELDSLIVKNHPDADPETAAVHACGHNAQCAILTGVAAALKEPGALDGMCGSIRLIAVPAEELIELGYREELRKQGIIRYYGGKVEFIYRGYLDGVDMAMMIHAGKLEPGKALNVNRGCNGCVTKNITFKGVSAHAGGAPQNGRNALYAATCGLNAVNALRETFTDDDHIRFHPIMMGVNCAVNIIPDEMKIESYVRGKTIEAIKRENKKVNRALTGAALALGAGVELCDRPGYSPEYHDPAFMKLVEQCCCDLVGADRVAFDYNSWSTGSSDFGDLTCVMPGVQFHCGGASGTGHGIDYFVTDPNRLCVNSAKAQLFVTDALLGNGAETAKEIIANYKPQYPSIKAYFEAINDIILDKDAVKYDENGNATVDFQNV